MKSQIPILLSIVTAVSLVMLLGNAPADTEPLAVTPAILVDPITPDAPVNPQVVTTGPDIRSGAYCNAPRNGNFRRGQPVRNVLRWIWRPFRRRCR